jgi:2-oxoglutarate ferredoxin oxidoreductase subunit alpha
VLLFPANPEECFHQSVQAFDLAERLQTPVIVLTDLDIGMNDWMTADLKWDDKYQPDRGKVLNADELENLETFHRYLDTDGDGIASRTLPGVHPKGAYFTRGSGHNMFGKYTESADEYLQVMDRLRRKWETAKTYVPGPVVDYADKNRIGVISIGSCDNAIQEARTRLAAQGLPVNYLRVRAFPFTGEVQKFIEAHDRVYIVEQNRDAQLKSLIRLELNIDEAKLMSILHYNGLPIVAENVLDGMQEELAKVQAA